MKDFLKRYSHAWLLLYMVVYFVWFFILEAKVTTNYTPVHIWLDDLIPFNEWFIIPYYLWFVFISATVLYLLFTSKEDYYKCCAFLFIGMTICLIIYSIWPNGQNLRPDLDSLGRSNFMIDIVRGLYSTDTNTNVCPSIHVFNSIGAQIAICHCDRLKDKKWLKCGSFVLTVAICLSTMFLKQHSVFDGICAVGLSIIMYLLVYVPDYSRVFARFKKDDDDSLLANESYKV